jgi:hypothetical protein
VSKERQSFPVEVADCVAYGLEHELGRVGNALGDVRRVAVTRQVDSHQVVLVLGQIGSDRPETIRVVQEAMQTQYRLGGGCHVAEYLAFDEAPRYGNVDVRRLCLFEREAG